MLSFLYKTKPGRIILKALVQPNLSKAIGKLLDSKISKPFIPLFQKAYQIDTDDISVPANGFQSFNQFFCRQRKPEAIKAAQDDFISPCDCFLSVYNIDEDARFEIKHSLYSVESLLLDASLVKEFMGGIALVFRLTPAHYHRYSFISEGTIIKHKRIEGILHTVQPIAVENTTVFHQNTREYSVIDSNTLGRYVQMEVGAMLVGRIVNSIKDGPISLGQEKGYFEYGGSTIIMLLKRDCITISESLLAQLKAQNEVSIHQFDTIGKIIPRPNENLNKF